MRHNDAGFVDLRLLNARVEALAHDFATSQPFRHVVIDGFLPDDIARSANRSFPPFDTMQVCYAGLVEARAIERRLDVVDPLFAAIFQALYSAEFIAWMERLTGISGLEPDRTFNGTGLHQVRKGGYHNVHADENRHPVTGLYQRLNLIIYLNERWEPHWGGALELWDSRMQRAQRSVAPLLNRCLIMETHDRAFHGYPPIVWPEDDARKSLTCWFFARKPGPLQHTQPHATLFQLRPNDTPKQRAKHYLHPIVRRIRQFGGPFRGGGHRRFSR